jgi:hypothetical protein
LVEHVVEAEIENNTVTTSTCLCIEVGGFVCRWIMNIPKHCAAFMIRPWRISCIHTRMYSK